MYNLKGKTELKEFLTISIICLLLINISLVSAYIMVKYGTITLGPGEKYTLNIPFIGQSKSPLICGKAIQTDGNVLENVTVIAKNLDTESIIAQNTTKKDGKFCISLPEINKTTRFDIYIEYDNLTLVLGNKDYQLNFDNHKVYIKSIDNYALLSGNITNFDAPVENGRFEIKMGQRINGTWKYIFGDYQKFSLNIGQNEIYQVPNEELNFSWDITELDAGEYKFLLKTSFNGKEYSTSCSKCSVFFNITG